MRLFVAVALPERLRREVASLLAGVRPDLPPARWVDAANLHLTLAFLGAVEAEAVEDLVAALGRACAPLSPFEAELGEAGTFPPRGPGRVAWIAVEAREGSLERLEAAVSEACSGVGGHAAGRRRFHPHVTVARVRRGWNADARRRWEAAVPAGLGGAFPVCDAVLYESRLSPEGARYRELARLPLEAAA